MRTRAFMFHCRVVLLLVLVVSLFSLATASAAAPVVRPNGAGQVTEYLLPKGFAAPQAITVGPDGNLWFTELENGYYHYGRKIGKMTT